MYLKNINYDCGLSVVFSSIHTHSDIHYKLKSVSDSLSDTKVVAAGFAYAHTGGEREIGLFRLGYKSTTLKVENDNSDVKVSDYKYLTPLFNSDCGEFILSNRKVSDRSILLDDGSFSVVVRESVFDDKYELQYSGDNEFIKEVFMDFYFSR